MNLSKVVVVTGTPGVGKSTVLSDVEHILKERGVGLNIIVFGSAMLEEALSIGIKDRDNLRKLPVAKQKELQVKTAQKISRNRTGIVFVDTHLFINTNEGYCPGLPQEVLKALSPTNLVLIQAKPSEIMNRRNEDESRKRDKTTKANILAEQDIARHLLGVTSVLTGSPMLIVKNSHGKSEDTAKLIIDSLGCF